MYSDAPEAVEIVRRAFPGYHHIRGRLKVEPFSPGVRPTSYWAGGSKDEWALAPILPGVAAPALHVPENGNGYTDIDQKGGIGTINALPHGCALVRWTRGRFETATIMVPPENLAGMLTAPAPALSHDEDVVLACTAGYKAFARRENAARAWASPYNAVSAEVIARWDAAKASLVAKGLLRRDGAITTEGRNRSKGSNWLQNLIWNRGQLSAGAPQLAA